MKRSIALLLSTVACTAFSGQMGNVSNEPCVNFATISGGYYGSNYMANFKNYELGVLTQESSFNDVNSTGYGQLGLGRQDRIGSLIFDHQIVMGKLWNGVNFNTTSSNWKFNQSFDFGYDWMPKISLFQQLDGYGVLGAHYGRFSYEKNPHSVLHPLITTFNVYDEQLGFNLGAGLNYRINPFVTVGIKYQHLQYAPINVNGTNAAGTSIDVEHVAPSFNLGGLELRYYF